MMKWKDLFSPKILAGVEASAGAFPPAVGRIKREASEALAAHGTPSVRMEAWRKTSLARLRHADFEPALPQDSFRTAESSFDADVRIVLENGMPQPGFPWTETPEAIYGCLSEAFRRIPELTQYFDRLADRAGDITARINTALFREGLFVKVPAGAGKIRIHIINRTSGTQPLMWHNRILAVIGEGADVEWIRQDVPETGSPYLATATAEFFVHRRARLRIYDEQEAGPEATFFLHRYFALEEESVLENWTFPWGGALMQQHRKVFLDRPGSEAAIRGLALPQGDEQTEHWVEVVHGAESCISDQKFKGIVRSNGQSLFNGRIVVQPGAQQTRAYQKNDHILLSDDARAYSRPFLEIYADDVSCSHGSTTGAMDREALFYMRQRGLPAHEAQLMLLEAFAGEIVQSIPADDLRAYFGEKLKSQLALSPHIPEVVRA